MATLVLGAAGAALAGPWGAVLGSMAGQTVDRSLFSQVRQGPRLGDLAVQTSQYGNLIPRVYGKMRVAGTVIWATDLIESSELVSTGKSGPDTQTYSYSASFAVALSSRPAQQIRRIWADGRLLRGEKGDFKVATKFRFYTGSEDQPIDPLIASVEGIGRIPAFRGLAVAVFEQMQLASFGNRIPVITFELEADAEDIRVRDILADASGSVLQAENQRPIHGYAAYGSSIGEALAPLLSAARFVAADRGGQLEEVTGKRVVHLRTEWLGCGAPSAPPTERGRVPDADLPATVSLSYYDPALNYQQGEQQAHAGGGRLRVRTELPGVLRSDDAKAWAEALLTEAWHHREQIRFRLPLSFSDLVPGDLLILGEQNRQWLIERVSLDDFVVVADCVQHLAAPIPAQPSDAGRPVQETDLVADPTQMRLLELPPREALTSHPIIHVAAAGGASPWRPVPISIAVGSTVIQSSTARKRAVLGRAETMLSSTDGESLEGISAVIVQLHHSDDWLSNADEEALAASATLALLGRELLQFGKAEPLGSGRFRLSQLVRGKQATEWALNTHEAGELFCLIEESALVPVQLPLQYLGEEVVGTAHGLQDEDGKSSARLVLEGESMRAPSPVDLQAQSTATGDLRLSWRRRTFYDLDGSESESGAMMQDHRYTVVIRDLRSSISLQVTSEEVEISSNQMQPFGGSAVLVEVADVSGLVPSRAVSTIIEW